VRDAVERVVISGHEGKSGAGLERVRLGDGRAFIVKRIRPDEDLTMRVAGPGPGCEYRLWSSGVFDRLPDGVSHALVDAWLEDDTTVLVMRDLGSSMLTWSRRLSATEAGWAMERTARLHRAFLGSAPSGVAQLDMVLNLFSPATIAAEAAAGVELLQLAMRGWELFAELVPADVAEAVAALHRDIDPLVRAFESGPVTMTHGDLATVNMAFSGDTLVLIDWAMPVAAPGTLDVARFIAGCASVVDCSREELIDAYRRAAGPAYDEGSMALALLAGLIWLGWNKALDAVEHPDPAIRVRERDDLEWWVAHARTALETGVL
jgi:thiamine kinase-like enzyme